MIKWNEIVITNKQRGYTTKLANGMEVCLVPNSNFQEAHASFTTKYGSIHRNFVYPKTNEFYQAPDGVAHFLEHKMFDQPDGADVFLAFSQIGASANAYTSHEQTSYIFSANQKIAEAVTILLDYVQKPYFTDQSVEKEKGIIEQEIQMYEDQFSWIGYRYALEQSFPNHPVGIDIAGSVASIKAISKTDLYTCYETFYHPSNMQLVLSGNFDLAEIKAVIIENQALKEYQPQAEIKLAFTEDVTIPATKAIKKQIDAQTNYVSALFKDIRINANVKQTHHIYEEMIVDIILDMLFSNVSAYYDYFIDEFIVDTGISCYATYEKQYAYTLTQVKTKDPNRFIETYKQCWYEGKTINEKQFERVRKMQIGMQIQGQSNMSYITSEMTRLLEEGLTPDTLLTWLKTITFMEVEAKYQEIVSQLDDYLSFVLLEGTPQDIR
ncbi:MAG: EF-P 5-aminopentanol modification-associated protein YfmH [Culicoidibacterales bacterium]